MFSSDIHVNCENQNSVVLDVLQTRSDDVIKENKELKKEIEKLKHDIESDSTVFNMKVVELQNKFYQVEEQILMKDKEIERLRDCTQSIATETEILEDTLTRHSAHHMPHENFVPSVSGIYTSLNIQFPNKPLPMRSQILSCVQQFLLIAIFVAIIITITFVIPLKLAFS